MDSKETLIDRVDNGLSLSLLNRARAVTTEHDTLSKSLAEKYDSKTAKRVGELARVANALKEWERAKESIAELKSLLNDPDTDNELRSLALEDLNMPMPRCLPSPTNSKPR